MCSAAVNCPSSARAASIISLELGTEIIIAVAPKTSSRKAPSASHVERSHPRTVAVYLRSYEAPAKTVSTSKQPQTKAVVSA